MGCRRFFAGALVPETIFFDFWREKGAFTACRNHRMSHVGTQKQACGLHTKSKTHRVEISGRHGGRVAQTDARATLSLLLSTELMWSKAVRPAPAHAPARMRIAGGGKKESISF